MEAVFKPYPWEWLAADAFANDMGASATLLLPTHVEAHALSGQPLVKKPFLLREGANVELFDAHGQRTLAVDGGYGAEGHVYETVAPVARFAAPEATSWHGPQDAMHAVLGTWVVGDEAVGRRGAGHSAVVQGGAGALVDAVAGRRPSPPPWPPANRPPRRIPPSPNS